MRNHNKHGLKWYNSWVFTGTAGSTYGFYSVATDNVGHRLWNDGAPEPTTWTTYAGGELTRAWELRDLDGPRTVHARFRDQAGNTTLVNNTIILDRMPPALDLTQPAEGTYFQVTPLKVDGSKENGAWLQVCLLEVGECIPPTGLSRVDFPFNFSTLAAGRNTLVATALDAAGNTTTVTHTFTYDPDAPAITDFTPVGAIRERQPTISAVFDNPGAAPLDPAGTTLALVPPDLVVTDITTAATVTDNGFSYTPPAPLAEGNYQVRVTLTDLAENSAYAEWDFTVDAATYVTLTQPAETYNCLRGPVAGRAEPGATVTLSVDGQPAGSTTATVDGQYRFDAVIFHLGENVLVATATDVLGNTAAAERRILVDQAEAWAAVQAIPPVFSPGGALGFTTFALTATAPLSASLASWRFAVTGGSGVVTQTGGSAAPPVQFLWEGRDLTGNLVAEGDYAGTLTITATNGSVYTTAPCAVTADRTPPTAPIITEPLSGQKAEVGLLRVAGTAELGAFITLYNDGVFTVTLPLPVPASGCWSGECPLHTGRNTLTAVADDTTGVTSPRSNAVVVLHQVEPPLYAVGTDPAIVSAGETTSLWATVRGQSHLDGAPTLAAWAYSPYGERLPLTGTVNAASLWTWAAPWAVPAGLASQDVTVHYTAVDADGFSGEGEVGLSIRNAPPAPEIVGPPLLVQQQPYYIAVPDLRVAGRVRSAERLTVTLYANGAPVTRTRSVGWTPALGSNWQATPSLPEDGRYDLRAGALSDFGLTSALGLTHTVILDTQPPLVTLSALPPFTRALGLDFDWQAVETGSGVATQGLQRFADGAWNTLVSGGAEYHHAYLSLQEGRYRFRARAVDGVGHVGYSAEQAVVVDRTRPGLTLQVSEESLYAYVDGTAIYYGPATGVFTVTAALSDATAGLAEVAFPDTVSAGETYSQGGVLETTADHIYAFDAEDSFEDNAEVVATDRAGNAQPATFHVFRDDSPPDVWVSAPARVTTHTVPLTWGGQDSASGLAGYDVDLQVDAGDWQRVLTHTHAVAHTFTDLPGERYTFRVTATDHVGNAATAERIVGRVQITKYYYHGGQRVAQRQGQALYFLHPDHLGSTSLTTDAAGNVVARRRYAPYGKERWVEGALPTDFGFTHDSATLGAVGQAGQRDVPGTGLMYYRARYYHPALGRFISADTIVPNPGDPQSLNRYSYVRNNPLKYTDPSGHFANVIVGAVIGAVIGAAVSAGPQMIKNVREGQPLTTNIDPGEVAKAAAVGAVGGAVAGATFGLALAAAPAVGLGTGLGAHVAAGAASGVVAGQASRATGNALEGQRITQGLGNPGEMAWNAALGGAGGAVGYGIGKVINAASRTDVVLSGHGGYIVGDGMITVPDGTSVTTYSKFGGVISDRLGNAIEIGEIPSGIYAKAWGPGQRMPNYTLYPPGGLTITGNPITVRSPTQLSTLLRPAMGRIHWAACTAARNVKWAGQVWDIGGVWYENLPH